MLGRTIISLGYAALLAMGTDAMAQPLPAENVGAPAYAVPVETIAVGKGNQGFFETSFSISGYQFTKRDSFSESNTLTSAVEARQSQISAIHFTFSSPAKTVLVRGTCGLQASGTSLLVFRNITNADVYGCKLENLPVAEYALAVSVPQFTAVGTFGITAQVNLPEKYKSVKAAMLYKGVAYEAVPSGIDDRPQFIVSRRIVTGYTILQDGKPVGAIRFNGTADDKGIVTLPVAQEDGREAVIFLAAQLLVMPEAEA